MEATPTPGDRGGAFLSLSVRLQRLVAAAIAPCYPAGGADEPFTATIQPCWGRRARYADYACNVAFAIAEHLPSSSPASIAQALAAVLSPHVDGTVTATPAGWLNLRLSDRAIATEILALATWLAAQDRSMLATSGIEAILLETAPFGGYTYVQYAYARCCSVLRLRSAAWSRGAGFDGSVLTLPAGRSLALAALFAGDVAASSECGARAIAQAIHLTACFLSFYAAYPLCGVADDVARGGLALADLTRLLLQNLVADRLPLPEFL